MDAVEKAAVEAFLAAVEAQLPALLVDEAAKLPGIVGQVAAIAAPILAPELVSLLKGIQL